jgi:hypothetical protein
MSRHMIACAFWTCNSPMGLLRGPLRGLLRSLRMVYATMFEHTYSRHRDTQDASILTKASLAI